MRIGSATGVLAVVAAVATLGAASASAEAATLRHDASKFRVTTPKGYALTVAGGAYSVAGPGLSVTIRVIRTGRGARGVALAQRPKGARVVLRRGGARTARVVTVGSGTRTAILVRRRGGVLLVTTGSFAAGRPGLATVVRRIAASIRGGVPRVGLATGPGRLFPLTPYRAPDGGATAWVPYESDWVITSGQGALEGSGPRGNFLLGQSFNVILPGFAPPGSLPPGTIVHPFTSAIGALEQVWPLINQSVGVGMQNVRIRAVIGDATIPTFRSSGMMIFDYTINGRPWVGVANVATEDRLSSYQNFFWQLYISVIGVPADGDPTVGAGLRLVWRSWNPSGAIAQRTSQARQILEEINQTWRGVAEFRSRTADQQSRDVSCLLRTGPFIDDNARLLGLPPLLDCDSTYVRRNPA